jgi:hypothetical protein
MKMGKVLKSCSAVKPNLTDANKAQRVAYCESFVGHDGYFKDMLDQVDIDEKWWYLTQVATGYYICPGKKVPDRFVKHKAHIEKIMCLTATARPRQNPVTGVWWDGKIGTWFFYDTVPAKQS